MLSKKKYSVFLTFLLSSMALFATEKPYENFYSLKKHTEHTDQIYFLNDKKPPSKPLTKNDTHTHKKSQSLLKAKKKREIQKFLRTFSHDNAYVYVFDDELLNAGRIKPIENAEVHWLQWPNKTPTLTKQDGIALSPYPQTLSLKFIVTAKGYVPAIGYAKKGKVSPVSLYKEERISHILKSFINNPFDLKKIRSKEKSPYMSRAGEITLLGKILDSNYRPIEGLKVHYSETKPTTESYSTTQWGLYHPGAKETGPWGEFALWRVPKNRLSSFKPYSENFFQLPEAVYDLSGLETNSNVFSLTLHVDGQTHMDAEVLEEKNYQRPSSGTNVSFLGNTSQIESPDIEGVVYFNKVYNHNFTPLIRIRSQQYMNTLSSPLLNRDHKPTYFPLYDTKYLSSLLYPFVNERMLKKSSTAIGHINPQIFHDSYYLKVLEPNFKANPAFKVLYFDLNNKINPRLKSTHREIQSFAIINLDPQKEYHAFLMNAETHIAESVQVFRTDYNSVTQIEF